MVLPSVDTYDDDDGAGGTQTAQVMLNKVPEVTVSFWLIKVLATTVGETAADFLNESSDWA